MAGKNVQKSLFYTENEPDLRVFLGLDRPPLVTAIEWLEREPSAEEEKSVWSLGQYIIVVPTERSKFRFEQLLAERSEAENRNLDPPMVVTLGELPELLYVSKKELASELVQQIAWANALAEITASQFKKLTGREEDERPADWQPLAAMIGALHDRLAADLWNFSGVAKQLAKLPGFLKAELFRWQVLAAVEKNYYQMLNEANLWDKQAARLDAVGGVDGKQPSQCYTTKTIVMLATADLPRLIGSMVQQIASAVPDQLKILVAAPQSMADRFDGIGRLIVDQWLDATISISDDSIRVVDQPIDQAMAAVEFLPSVKERKNKDVTIGVPDESVIPQLERTLKSRGIASRSLPGRRLLETPPAKFLEASRDYLRDFSFDAFAALVRHPDVFEWLCQQVQPISWISDLTVFQNDYLPETIWLLDVEPFGDPEKIASEYDSDDAASQARAKQRAEAIGRLNQVHAAMQPLLGALVRPEGDVFGGMTHGDAYPTSERSTGGDAYPTFDRPVSAWAPLWHRAMLKIYEDRESTGSHEAEYLAMEGLNALSRLFEEQARIPERFQPTVSAIDAVHWVLKLAASRRVLAPENPDAIELAGWLDLALDDVPVLIVTGVNDGHVGSSERDHAFLPNELCKKLEIGEDDRRFARDTYAMTVMTSVRTQYHLIAGRHEDGGEPLKPSRLLFADTPLVSAKRAQAFFNYAGKKQTLFWLGDAAKCPPNQSFEIPKPHLSRPVEQISVTKFREYLKCPYRFYLDHVMRLETVTDDWRELDAGRFGTLLHDCLEHFGKSDERDATHPERILRFLNDALNQRVARQTQGTQHPALEIQLQQIRLRFERFSQIQADRRSAGWFIASTEEMIEHDFDVDGKPFRIRGKIDRIDQHEITGQIAVWDYKSSDKGDGPLTYHYAPKKKEWKDLQLPLYRYLVQELEPFKNADLSNLITGYVLLPKRLEEIRFEETGWTEAEYEEAAGVARQVLRQIRRSIFWPPSPEPPLFSEDFAAICQDNVFEKYEIANPPELHRPTRKSPPKVNPSTERKR